MGARPKDPFGFFKDIDDDREKIKSHRAVSAGIRHESRGDGRKRNDLRCRGALGRESDPVVTQNERNGVRRSSLRDSSCSLQHDNLRLLEQRPRSHGWHSEGLSERHRRSSSRRDTRVNRSHDHRSRGSRAESSRSRTRSRDDLLQAEWRARDLSLAVENIPWDMDWLELKNLGRLYGFVAHARTIKQPGTHVGFLEYSKPEDVARAVSALHGQMIQGSAYPLRVRQGIPVEALLPRSLPGPKSKWTMDS
uniref:RRM domain-containing protein n=1 Tax=Noctiluca scintillans TaxID=2966 RepID=A0A7S1FJM3_NOCSC